MATPNVLRGAIFFSWFLPSFTNLGYKARQLTWSKQTFDFSEQTWLVTGASTGIGREIARSAAAAGATVYAVARSENKLKQLAAEVPWGKGRIEPMACDLSLMTEVRALAEDLKQRGVIIDTLVNNVGLMLNERTVTAEGLETGFATNVLGHFLLTELLLDDRALTPGACIINMSSGGMYNVPLDLRELQGGSRYDGTMAYAYHKRAQVALNEHWRRKYADRAAVYVMHPGWVATPGVETAMPEFNQALSSILRSPEAGADTALWLAQTRPQQAGPGIWFDRALRGAHFFAGTRAGDSIEALVAHLQGLTQSTDLAA